MLQVDITRSSRMPSLLRFSIFFVNSREAGQFLRIHPASGIQPTLSCQIFPDFPFFSELILEK